MKKQLLFFALALCFIPLMSFKSIRAPTMMKFNGQTITELGDFQYGTQEYSVWGDKSTGTVTAIKFLYPGSGDVYSFSGTYYSSGWPLPHGANPYLSVSGYGTSSSSSYFSYSGPIEFY